MTTAIGVEPIPVNRGTDFVLAFNWKETDGTNANLTGWSISTMDVSSAISSLLTATITTPATGLITIRIEWNDALQAGVPYLFRVKLTSGTEDVSSNLLQVTYQ